VKKPHAIGLLILTALLWSFGGLLIKWIPWNPMAIAGTRSGIAAIVILTGLGRPKLKWSPVLVAGAVAYCATVLLFVVATKWTTAANAILLQYTAPIYVAIFSRWFLGERIARLDWATITVVLSGMSLFFVERISAQGFWGNVCAILSGVGFAWMTLLLRKQKDASPVASVLLGNLLTFLICVPFCLTPPATVSSWVALLLLGIFQIGLSYILYSMAIRHVTALEASLFPILEPILNPLWVSLFIGERPGFWEFAGGLLVLSAMSGRGLLLTFRPAAVGMHNQPTKNPGETS
jgi:drug/metabolite transporter (DMT)-like permease